MHGYSLVPQFGTNSSYEDCSQTTFLDSVVRNTEHTSSNAGKQEGGC